MVTGRCYLLHQPLESGPWNRFRETEVLFLKEGVREEEEKEKNPETNAFEKTKKKKKKKNGLLFLCVCVCLFGRCFSLSLSCFSLFLRREWKGC